MPDINSELNHTANTNTQSEASANTNAAANPKAAFEAELSIGTKAVVDYIISLLNQNHIPTYCFDSSIRIMDQVLDHGLRKAIYSEAEPDSYRFDLTWDIEPRTLYFITDEFQCSYIILKMPDSEGIMLCGPVIFEQIQEDRLIEIADRLQMPPPSHGKASRILLTGAFCVDAVLLLFHIYSAC